ncbi:50S ribosomal protein L10 [Patescibacteria group bacterium]|nr:50S ribosomal protein L10 [Patescibacteria group bacterium]MBU1931813.1 50S ribosomal protein L10 [Patescibacteria group bacterium]
MPSQKNIEQLKLLAQKLEQAKSVVLADYHGLSVDQIQGLRQQIKQVGGELMVAKNTLLKLALDKVNPPANGKIPEDKLTGPTITLFGYEDEIAPLKVLAEFAAKHQLPQIKAGLIINEYLSADQLNQLAKLPGKPELLAKLIGTINAPRVNLVFVLKANLQKLVLTLKAIKEVKNND